jgi:N-acylneuraminate cytidylyltransferase
MEEDILADMAANLPRYGIPMPAIWLRLKPTNPFRRLDHAREAIDLLLSRPDIDSVRHVSRAETRVQGVNQEGFLEPLSPEWPAGRSVIRRTEFPTAYQVFNLDVLRHRNWETLGSGYMGTRVHPIIGESITSVDINDADDFDLVKALIETRPRPDVVSRHLVVPRTD